MNNPEEEDGLRPFVQRLFEIDGEEEALACFIFSPYQAAGGEFRCDYTICGRGKTAYDYACGIDGLQALLLALRAIHTKLLDSDDYKSGKLTWLNEQDLGMPEAFF